MERCRLCAQKTNLCKSHVISNFVVRETRGKGGGAKLLNITSEESPRVARDQNQNTEYLLCRRCEDKRQEWEGIVAATIVGKGDGREIRPRISVDLNGEGQFKNVRYGPLKLWVLSTIYLMHCTQKKVGHWVRLTGEEKARMKKWTPGIGQCGKWNLPRVSGCQIAVSLVEVHRIGGASVQCAVTAPGVVETEVAGQSCPKLGGRFVGPQVHVLVLDAA